MKKKTVSVGKARILEFDYHTMYMPYSAAFFHLYNLKARIATTPRVIATSSCNNDRKKILLSAHDRPYDAFIALVL